MNGVVSAGQVSREEVAAFLDRQQGSPEGLVALTGGAWSSAWGYRAGGDELVVRFGREVSWYEADKMAMAFGGPDLPVPQVREVRTTASGRAYAISVRHYGRFLEDTPPELAGALAPTLTRLLVALYRKGASTDALVLWHQPGASAGSWREFLLAGLVDDPGNLVHGWSAALAGDRELAALSAAPPGGCGCCRRLAPSAGTWSTAICCTATYRVPTPAGSKRYCPGSASLAATAQRLAEVLERGPLPLTSG